jgi:hypothetical protein
MNIPIKIKRSRGRPKKSVEIPVEPDVSAEHEIVETQIEPDVSAEHEIVETQKEPIIKPVRKVNKWVDHCTDVKTRKENVGKSYREILKIAKLDYNK